MLEIAKSNNKTSNNSTKPAIATLAISIAKLAATTPAIPIIAILPRLTTLAILIIAIPLRPTTLAIPVAAAPFKRNTCKAIRGCVASSVSWSNCIKGVLGKLVNLIAKKF
jgi:hypothetical protein